MLDEPVITDCVSGNAVFRAMNERARKGRFPFAASVALTYRCNLRCVHCYSRTSVNPDGEWSTEAWKAAFDQLAEAGCLFLLITGGEPLLRSDFAEIYRYARERGLVVTVFSNGTLVTDAILDLFQTYPPRNVDVTIYGATEATTSAMTGGKEVFSRCLDGVKRMVGRGIHVALKSVVTTLNRHEIGAMAALADELGVSFRTDASLFPRIDGDTAPLRYRLKPAEIAELDFSKPRMAEEWKSYYERRNHPLGAGPLYRCAAGRTHAHINPHGELQPCVTASHIRIPLSGVPFSAAWLQLQEYLGRLESKADSACIRCEKHVLCGYCPGFCRLDTGDEQGFSQFLCELGHERYKRVISMASSGR